MLRRILSAFLLCLCISPVWGDCPITDNYRDYIKSGGDTPTCEVRGVSNTKGACIAVGNYWVTAIDKLKNSILVACDANLLGRQYNGCWYYKQGLVYDEDTENYYYRWEHYNPKEIKINVVGTSAWLPPCVLDYDWDLVENRVPYEKYVTWYAGCDSYADRVLIRGDKTEITTPYYVSFRDDSASGGCAERVGGSAPVHPDMVYCYAYKCKEGYHINNRRCVNDDASGESSESATVPVQGTISESKQRCLESRESGEGKACCHWAKTVAKWENNQCVCVNPHKVFKMNDDGQTGECVDNPAGASQSSDVTDDEVRSLLSTPSGDCANEEKRIIPIGENDSCGTDAGPVSVEACVKDMKVPDEVLPNVGAQQIGVTSRGFASNTQGCFNKTDIPGNNKYKLSFLGYKPVYVCANQLKKDKVVCLEQDSVLDDVEITSAYDCEQDVLAKLNAVSGKKMFWDNIEDGYAKAYCDIVCADGHTRQEQETIVEFQEDGQTFKTKQRYICVANDDVTTDNTVTPTPVGGDNSGATAPAKPDGTPCTPTDKNAKSGKYQNGECIIVECKESYYKVSDDKKSCVEDKKAKSQAKIDELQKNADAMKEKEQSTANKLLGGAAIGATGIGAMQAASAYSEQQADEEAETAMRAYLATFHCNYGGGINVPGGEKDVQLPGGNELIDLYAEYVNLANNLKVRKAALDLRPGIESEAILDSATSGLYDDVAIGKTSGAFTSLARALQDPTGEDAKAWAAQKDDSAKKMKTGLTVAGIGAIGGAVGNLLINKDAPKENSKEILDKYKDGDLTGKVSKSPDGTLVAESVNQESKPESGIVIQDKDLGQETNMNQNQSGNWVHIVKSYEVGFYCEDLFDNVYRSCFAMNNDDYARFQQSKFSEITNNAERCYQRLVQCKQESRTFADIEETCIRAVASEFSIDMSGANNADCTDNLKTDFTWKSHIFQEQSTVNDDASVLGVVADAVGLDLGEIGGLNNPIAPGADITDQCYVRTVGHGNEPFGFVLEKGSIKECYSKYYYEGYDADDPLKWVKKNLAKINANRAAQGLAQCSGGYVTSTEFMNLIRDYEKICRTLSCKYQHMYRSTNRYKKDDASSSSTWYYTYNGKEYPLLLDANDGCDNPDDSELDYYFFVHTVSEWENEPTTAVFQPVCLFSYGPDTFRPVKFEGSKQEEWVEAKLNLSDSSVEYEVSARHDLYVTTKRNTSGKGTVYMGTGGILVMPITNRIDYETYLGCPD